MNINNKYAMNERVWAYSSKDYNFHIGRVVEIKIDTASNISYMIHFDEDITTTWVNEDMVRHDEPN